jgi:hypothetical protein
MSGVKWDRVRPKRAGEDVSGLDDAWRRGDSIVAWYDEASDRYHPIDWHEFEFHWQEREEILLMGRFRRSGRLYNVFARPRRAQESPAPGRQGAGRQPPGRKPGQDSPKSAMCAEAVAILNNNTLRPPPKHGRVTKIANMIQPKFPGYKPGTITGYISDAIRQWVVKNPGK